MNDVCKHQVLPPVLYLVPHFNINGIYWFLQISVSQQTSSRMHCADLSTAPSLIQQKALQFGPKANTYLLRRTKQLFTFQKTPSVFSSVQLFISNYYYSILPQLQSAATGLPYHGVSIDWPHRKSQFRRKKKRQSDRKQTVEQHSSGPCWESLHAQSLQRCKGMSHSLRWFQEENTPKLRQSKGIQGHSS